MFGWLFIIHVFTMFVVIALLVFHIRDVFRNSTLPDDRRSLWAIVLFLGAPIAMPVYWWYYIWSTSTSTGQVSGPRNTGAA